MSKIVNIGIIVRNEQGDTFPVALMPQMVSVIQNLLMQIPMTDSKLVDPSGKKLSSNESIPIIPREIEFDWDAAYCPMDREVELDLMKKLNERYDAMAESESIDGSISTDIEVEGGKLLKLNPETGKPAMLQDPLNPFNVSLAATGTANKGMTDAEVEAATQENDQKLIEDAKYPDSIATQEGEQVEPIRQDVTVTPEVLPLAGKEHLPS